MQKSTVRDNIIELTCGNLIMAECLDRQEVAKYMRHISEMTDSELAEQLVESRGLLDNRFARLVNRRRN